MEIESKPELNYLRHLYHISGFFSEKITVRWVTYLLVMVILCSISLVYLQNCDNFTSSTSDESETMLSLCSNPWVCLNLIIYSIALNIAMKEFIYLSHFLGHNKQHHPYNLHMFYIYENSLSSKIVHWC